MELFSSRGLLSVHPKSYKCPTSVMNGKTYEYINMDNIQLVRDLLGEKSQKQIHEDVGSKVYNIISIWMRIGHEVSQQEVSRKACVRTQLRKS